MLVVVAALAAFSPLTPVLPLSVEVKAPDGSHQLLPVNHTSGRLVEVCSDGKERVCAPIVVHQGRATAVFDAGPALDADDDLHVVLTAPDAYPGSATAIAVGCGLVTGAAFSGAVVVGLVSSADGVGDEVSAGAGGVAVGLWLVSGVAAVGTGVAAAFALLDQAPRSE